MISDQETTSAPAMSTLALGIVSDVQSLVKQQLALFQTEIKKDFHKTQGAAVLLIGGLSVATASLALWGVMLALFIQSAAPNWPPGVCFGIAGCAFAIAAGTLLMIGKNKLSSVNPLPTDSVEAMKENLQWIVKTPSK